MALDLAKQVGPLPLGAWVVVVGGGLGIALYTRHNNQGADPVDTSGTGADPSVGDGSVGGWQSTQPAPADSSADVSGAVTDNDAWARLAINYLIAQGYDPAVSDSAIRKYVNVSGKLSTREWALVRIALMHLGSPPNPLPPGQNVPPSSVPTPHKPAPKPPKRTSTHHNPRDVRHYTVRRGDTLWAIAVHFYHHGGYWPRIYRANRRVIGANPNHLRAGEVLVIP